MYLINVSGGNNREWGEEIFKEIMAENFPEY